MKPVWIAVLFVVLPLALQADPPATLNGIAGIPFGSTVDQIKAAMDSRGAALDAGVSGAAHLEYKGGTFNNESVGYWHFYLADGKLYKASVAFFPADRQHFAFYDRVKKAISDKYGGPFQETRIDMDPTALFHLIQSGKADFEADWEIPLPSSHSITCRMFDREGGSVMIRVTYQDDVVAAQLSDKEANDF
jgi:hypothetical protein